MIYASESNMLDLDGSWAHAVTLLTSLPTSSMLRRVRLILCAPTSRNPDSGPIGATDVNWNAFIRSIRRFDRLLTIDVVIATFKMYGRYHSGVVSFFERSHDELLPTDRNYSLTVSYQIVEEWY